MPTEKTEGAIAPEAAEIAASMPFVVNRVKSVTLPLLKLAPGKPVYFRIDGPMYTGEKLTSGSEADRKKEPPTLIKVENLITRRPALVIVPAVMKSELEKSYADHAYVGRCFEVETTKVPEKRYNLVSITEIADPYAPVEAVEAAPDKAKK